MNYLFLVSYNNTFFYAGVGASGRSPDAKTPKESP